jgi:hypothetical protein
MPTYFFMATKLIGRMWVYLGIIYGLVYYYTNNSDYSIVSNGRMINKQRILKSVVGSGRDIT